MAPKKTPKRSDARASSSAKTVVGATRTPARMGRGSHAAEPAAKLVDEGEIGSGGSGSVRKAYDPNLRRVVATKVLAPELARYSEHVQRFIEEARLMARLDHPNIVPIHDLVADGESAYFVMKRVVGQTLDARVEAQRGQGSDGLHELLQVFLKVCDAVAFAHSRGVIHCDLKPENIMVGEFGEVYLMDWGIASQKSERVDAPAGHRSVRGTPAYMSPEQAEGSLGAISERTDIFGLGVVLYFILTGRPPFDGKTATQSLARARKGEHEDLESAAGIPPPPGLVRIVRRAMSPEPQDRFASALEMRHAVDIVLRSDWSLPTRVYPPGAAIVREGDFADAAYIIVRGHCAVSKTIDGGVQILRTLEPGAVFGETGILSGDRRTATVTAVGEVTVKIVTRELFRGQLGNDTWMGKFVLALADRFRELDAKMGSKMGGTMREQLGGEPVRTAGGLIGGAGENEEGSEP
jgi:serine/threonine-protein kinase